MAFIFEKVRNNKRHKKLKDRNKGRSSVSIIHVNRISKTLIFIPLRSHLNKAIFAQRFLQASSLSPLLPSNGTSVSDVDELLRP